MTAGRRTCAVIRHRQSCNALKLIADVLLILPARPVSRPVPLFDQSLKKGRRRDAGNTAFQVVFELDVVVLILALDIDFVFHIEVWATTV